MSARVSAVRRITSALCLILAALLPLLWPGRALCDGSAAGLEYIERIDGHAAATERLPMIVALHGLGDRPESFAEAFPALPFAARWIFLRAPQAFGSGHTWFDPPARMHDAAYLRRLAERVARAIAELVARRPTRGLPVLTGFSQGAVLSFAVAARGEPLALVIPVSGGLPAGYLSGSPARRPARVAAQHGEADERLPVQGATAAVVALQAVGGDATLKIYPGVGHSITAEMLRDHRALILSATRPERP